VVYKLKHQKHLKRILKNQIFSLPHFVWWLLGHPVFQTLQCKDDYDLNKFENSISHCALFGMVRKNRRKKLIDKARI
jgi:hypothetical protein